MLNPCGVCDAIETNRISQNPKQRMSKHRKLDQMAKKGLQKIRRLTRKQTTPEEIEQIVRDDPKMALMFGASELTTDQIAACAAAAPATAIVFAWYRMTPEMQAKCVKRAPAMALRIVCHELTREQFDYCKKRAPKEARDTTTQFFEAEFKMKKTDITEQ